MGHGRKVIFELFGVASSLLQEEVESPSNALSSVLLSHLRPNDEGEVDSALEINEENNNCNTLEGLVSSKQSKTEDDGRDEADDKSNHSLSGKLQSLKRECPTKPTKRRPRDRDTFLT